MSEKKNFRFSGPASPFGLLGIASTMGMHMVSGPLVGGGLGWLVDHWLDSWPIGFGIGILLGIAAGFRNVWADAKRLQRGQAELDAARAAGQEAGAMQQADEWRTKGIFVPKRPILPEQNDAPLPPREEAKTFRPADDVDKAWDAYTRLEQELKEEIDASASADDADKPGKHNNSMPGSMS